MDKEFTVKETKNNAIILTNIIVGLKNSDLNEFLEPINIFLNNIGYESINRFYDPDVLKSILISYCFESANYLKHPIAIPSLIMSC